MKMTPQFNFAFCALLAVALAGCEGCIHTPHMEANTPLQHYYAAVGEFELAQTVALTFLESPEAENWPELAAAIGVVSQKGTEVVQRAKLAREQYDYLLSSMSSDSLIALKEQELSEQIKIVIGFTRTLLSLVRDTTSKE